MNVGIVAALPAEGQCLSKTRLRPQARTRLAQDVDLELSGMGAAYATEAAEHLVAQGTECLISWGMAAGLDPSLRPGQLCLATRVLIETNESFETNEAWRENLRAVLGELDTISGTLIQSTEMVATVAAKKRLYHQSNAVALDMESGAIARVAHLHGLPFMAIRAIVDDASMALPKAARQAMDATGGLKIDRLFKGTLRSLHDIGHLWELARGFSAAKNALTKAGLLAGPRMCAPIKKSEGRKP